MIILPRYLQSLASRRICHLDDVSSILGARHAKILWINLIPDNAERLLFRNGCDMSKLLVLQSLIYDHISIDCGHGNLGISRVPADRIDNLLLKPCLHRVKISVVNGDKFHIVRIPHSHCAVI